MIEKCNGRNPLSQSSMLSSHSRNPLDASELRSLCHSESPEWFLGNLGHVPTQGSSKHLNLIEYAAGCNLQMLRALQNYLEGLEKRPDVAKKLGECRRERFEVNKFFPKAAKLDHSSFAAKNFCANLPKELKCAGE